MKFILGSRGRLACAVFFYQIGIPIEMEVCPE